MRQYNVKVVLFEGGPARQFETTMEYLFEPQPPSLALVCSRCGLLWCHLITEGAEQDFLPVAHDCRACEGGSLQALDFEYRVYELPPELFSRELVLYSQKRTTPLGTIYA